MLATVGLLAWSLSLSTGQVVAVIGVLLAVVAVFYFRANYGKYWRYTGRAMEISALNTLVFVGTIATVIAAAWGLSALCFAPGMWRNMLSVVLYSVLMSILGTPLIAGCTRFVERWLYR